MSSSYKRHLIHSVGDCLAEQLFDAAELMSCSFADNMTSLVELVT